LLGFTLSLGVRIAVFGHNLKSFRWRRSDRARLGEETCKRRGTKSRGQSVARLSNAPPWPFARKKEADVQAV
jgi:hypothetical protein